MALPKAEPPDLKANNETRHREGSTELRLEVPSGIIHKPCKGNTTVNKKADNKSKWKSDRKNMVKIIKKYTSALGNTGGGILWVQVLDKHAKDTCLAYFNELVDESLNNMIPDGTLFVKMCMKDWANEGGANKGLIRCDVFPSNSVVTCAYKTKEPLDDSIIDATSCKINRILKDGLTFQSKQPTIRGIGGKLDECRNIQMKALVEKNGEHTRDTDNFIQYIWKELKLRFCISAFSKVDGGGSFYLGIEESFHTTGEYKFKSWDKKGFEFPQERHEQFINNLKTKARNETLVLRNTEKTGRFTKEDLIAVAFHPVSKTAAPRLFVLEVAVAAVEGIVFYEHDGPEAYEVQDGAVTRLSLEEWYRRQYILATAATECKQHMDIHVSGSLNNTLSGENRNPLSREPLAPDSTPTAEDLGCEVRKLQQELQDKASEIIYLRDELDDSKKLVHWAEKEVESVLDMIPLGGLSLGSDSSSVYSSGSDSSDSGHVPNDAGGSSNLHGVLGRLREMFKIARMKRKDVVHASPAFFFNNVPVYIITDIYRSSPYFLQCCRQDFVRVSDNADLCRVSDDGTRLSCVQSPGHNETQRNSLVLYSGKVQFSLTEKIPNVIHYWEAKIEVGRESGDDTSLPVVEVGIAEHERDLNTFLSRQTQTWCISVEKCTKHRRTLCTNIRSRGVHVDCFPNVMSNSMARTFGILLDTGNGKVIFTDVDKTVILCKLDANFRKSVGPVFSVLPSPGRRTQLTLISGIAVTVTCEKQKFIHSCLH